MSKFQVGNIVVYNGKPIDPPNPVPPMGVPFVINEVYPMKPEVMEQHYEIGGFDLEKHQALSGPSFTMAESELENLRQDNV